MKNYSKSVTANVPQTQPLPGQNMVQNNAGGYSFKITSQELLERFLLIGTEGGTYYVKEQDLTAQNAESIINHIKYSGEAVVDTVLDFAVNNRAPKADAGIFVLALCTAYGNDETKKKAYAAISKVCKTSTHLFMFLANVQELRGWSRGLRRGVAKFYEEKKEAQIAYQLVKYRARAGFTHKDALRLSHAKATTDGINELFKYAVGKTTEAECPNKFIQAFGQAQTSTKAKEVISLIDTYALSWEMIPTEMLNDQDVLKALVDHMPLTALIRNLNRFSYNGLTNGNSAVTKKIVDKLTDEELVKKAGIHPINVVNAMMTYSSGVGTKGDKRWQANQNIVDALDTTFTLAIQALAPTGKNILIGVDVSGSMQSNVNGMAMSASQVANVLAVTILKSEKNAELVWFDTEIQKPTIGRRSSLDEVINKSPHGGGTDCAQALKYALDNKTSYDAILILTDNETWAGPRHGQQILDEYRRKVNPAVKVVEVAMVSNPSSNLPNDDKNLLRVVGFDASVVDVINGFLE